MENNNIKVQVYNLIILDKSGSMSQIADAAIAGFNETVGSIRSAQKQYAATQEHFVSLLPFCSCALEYVYDGVPVAEVRNLGSDDYQPCCNTPLYDAMGKGINDLHKKTKKMENAVVIVTVITDGMENASKEYGGAAIKALVDKMRDEYGWNFAYIGTNQNVEAVAHKLSIQNTMSFEYSSEGMNEAWRRERGSRSRMYSRMHDCYASAPAAAPASGLFNSLRDLLRSNNNYDEQSDDSNA